MKKLVLGTLICLAACGEYEPKFGSPEDHAVPQIVPDELGLKQSRVLMSPGRHIRFLEPDDWELYAYDSVPHYSYFQGERAPNQERYLGGIFYHPDDRVLCHVVSEFAPAGSDTERRVSEDLDDQIHFVFLQGSWGSVLDGFIDDTWLHADDRLTAAPMHEMQWYFVLWDTDYPALGFGVADTADRTSTHIFCYWVDGARGDNEFELLTQVRAAVRFVGVG